VVAALTRASREDRSILVRDYRAPDLEACAAIYAVGSAEALRRPVPTAPDAAFREATRGEVVLVGEIEGRIAGFAAIFVPEAFVHHLYVDGAARGRGVGATLLRAVRVRLGRRPCLKCRLDNTGALAFYARQGWTETERGTDAQAGPWVRLAGP
jgi:ribosomal protein S18 acetylase RimI-like enzyme